ncbi:proton-conducting transporter membrane subunit [Salinibacterium sp. TMP30]|uniref:proton-conducting transporter transmembrane domain-containing protein n=1 Tax=Salinibacterium sp. TMP30 TaxID=3138237 RepID=UPI00313A4815
MDVVILGAAMVSPWLAAVVAGVLSRAKLTPHTVGVSASAITGVGLLAVALLSIFSSTTSADTRTIEFGALQWDPLALIMALLVLGLSMLIQVFALRYLRGDARQTWFILCTNIVTGFTIFLVCAATVTAFVVAWIGAGAALVALLATYRQLNQAQDGIRRTALRFGIADSGLLIGLAIVLVAAGGDVPLNEVASQVIEMPLPLQFLVAALLVVSALARSSQIPFHGWLPFTLAAPTPVSALMHAGVVNAGAILLLRFSETVSLHQSVMIVIFLAGSATVVYASAVRLVRPDVKGRLVFSTMAQMGFMIMTCGLGLYAAAIFHLVAHSLFKSTLFLSAGTGMREHTIDRNLPVTVPTSRVVVVASTAVAVLAPVASLIAAKTMFAPNITDAELGLFVFVALTLGVTLGAGLLTHFSLQSLTLGIVVTSAVSFGYTVAIHLFGLVLDVANSGIGAPSWLLIIPAVGLIGVEVLARARTRNSTLRELVYTRSLSATISRSSLSKGLI